MGISSGPRFVATVQETGFLSLGWGAAILLAVVATTLLLGHALKIAYDELLGISLRRNHQLPQPGLRRPYTVPTDRPETWLRPDLSGRHVVRGSWSSMS